MTTDKLDLRFLVRVETSTTREFAKFSARLIFVTDNNDVRYPSATWAGSIEAPYADFKVTAQGNLNEPPFRWYAIEADYKEPYEVDLRRAEVMVKLLRKVERGLEKLEKDFGYCRDDLPQFLARVAQVLGVRKFAMDLPVNRNYTIPTADEYGWTDITGIQFQIGRETSKLLPAVTVE